MSAASWIFKQVGRVPSLSWDFVYRARRSLYRIGAISSQNYNFPIISVGNLAMGGTGKTPFTLWLSNHLVEKGLKPLILTRGYKSGLEEKGGLLDPQRLLSCSPEEYGDEPLMMAKNMKGGHILVGKERKKNLERYYKEILPDVVLLDDGFQHLKIQRDLNIVLIDSTMPLSQYHPPPLGFLREGLKSLSDADLIIFSRSEFLKEEGKKKILDFFAPYLAKTSKYIFMSFKPLGLINGLNGEKESLDFIEGRKVILLSAIASPKAFSSSMASSGAIITKDLQYADHHSYTQKDLSDIIAMAEESSSIIVCTEKDIVKLKALKNFSTFSDIYYLKVDVNFSEGKNVFLDLLDSSLGKFGL